jgi:hypothetical protein
MRAVRDHEIATGRRPSTAKKVLKGGSKLLGRLAPAYQFYENHKQHMPLVENTLRTGLSTAAGDAGVTVGLLCGPGAVVCSPALGIAASIAGDWTGGFVYDGLDSAYQHGIKPLGDAADDVGGAVKDGLGKIGIDL